MSEKKKNNVAVLLEYAGDYRKLTFLGLFLSAVAMVLGMLPYICIWLLIRDLVAVAPNWSEAANISRYGYLAFLFSFMGIAVYFFALMCTHLAAFRTAANIRKKGVDRLMKAPLGFFDNNASGLLRNRLNAGSADTETLLAHNLADIVGTIAMFLTTIVLMLVFDWRMGLACLFACVVSIASMFVMMGGKNAKLMAEYQEAQDVMSKAGTEYVRGIPVVKIFQQTVYSFKTFEKAINDYKAKAEHYQGDICRIPQAVNLTATEGVFIFLVPVVLLIAPFALSSGNFLKFVTNFAFYVIFSAIISTALARIMFAASGMMQADTALMRIDTVMNAPVLDTDQSEETPKDNSVEFKDVTFSFEGSDYPALENVSFRVNQGETVALVGPSGGGKTTAASLIPRFWDVGSGSVEVGGVDVRKIDPHVLMDRKWKAFMPLFFVVMTSALILMTAVINRVDDLKTAYLQSLLFLEVMNWYDGIVIDRIWVGYDRFWLLPKTEDLPYVQTWKQVLRKHSILSLIWIFGAGVAAVLILFLSGIFKRLF